VRCHVRQWRKGSAEEPYISHLLEVANLVTDTMQDGSKVVSLIDLLIAALREGGIEKSTFGEDIQSTNLDKSLDNRGLL
jgi:(p)ppGpp synthase/HD superfamily hydrolase